MCPSRVVIRRPDNLPCAGGESKSIQHSASRPCLVGDIRHLACIGPFSAPGFLQMNTKTASAGAILGYTFQGMTSLVSFGSGTTAIAQSIHSPSNATRCAGPSPSFAITQTLNSDRSLMPANVATSLLARALSPRKVFEPRTRSASGRSRSRTHRVANNEPTDTAAATHDETVPASIAARYPEPATAMTA